MSNFLEKARDIIFGGGDLQHTIIKHPAATEARDFVVSEDGYTRTSFLDDGHFRVETFEPGTRITTSDTQEARIQVIDANTSFKEIGRMNISPAALPAGFIDRSFANGDAYRQGLALALDGQQTLPAISGGLELVDRGFSFPRGVTMDRQTTFEGGMLEVERIIVGEGYTRKTFDEVGRLILEEIFGKGTDILRKLQRGPKVIDKVSISAPAPFSMPDIGYRRPIGQLSYTATQVRGIGPGILEPLTRAIGLRNKRVINGSLDNYFGGPSGGTANDELHFMYPSSQGWDIEKHGYRLP